MKIDENLTTTNPRATLQKQKEIKIGHRDVEIRVRSVRFTLYLQRVGPKLEKKIRFSVEGESSVLPGCSQSDLKMILEMTQK